MSLAYYTMDDLRLGRGGFLRKGWTIRQFPELGEALAHYRGIPITKRKVLGVTDGFHVLELVKSVPLLPKDEDGEDVLALELGAGQFPAVQALFGGGTAVKDVCGHDRVILLEHEEDPC